MIKDHDKRRQTTHTIDCMARRRRRRRRRR